MEAAAFGYADNRMTPAQVRAWFGEPDVVFRDNPRALCWSYATPYKVRMCWGPKRKAAWISHNVPNPLARELIEDRLGRPLVGAFGEPTRGRSAPNAFF
jgi:hypothetical protein